MSGAAQRQGIVPINSTLETRGNRLCQTAPSESGAALTKVMGNYRTSKYDIYSRAVT